MIVVAAVAVAVDNRKNGGGRGTRDAGNHRALAGPLFLNGWRRVPGSAVPSYARHQLHR